MHANFHCCGTTPSSSAYETVSPPSSFSHLLDGKIETIPNTFHIKSTASNKCATFRALGTFFLLPGVLPGGPQLQTGVLPGVLSSKRGCCRGSSAPNGGAAGGPQLQTGVLPGVLSSKRGCCRWSSAPNGGAAGGPQLQTGVLQGVLSSKRGCCRGSSAPNGGAAGVLLLS